MALARVTSLYHNIDPVPTTFYLAIRNSDGTYFIFADDTVWMTDGTQAGTPTDLGPLSSEPESAAMIKAVKGRRMETKTVYYKGLDGLFYEVEVGPSAIVETLIDTTLFSDDVAAFFTSGDPEISGREGIRVLDSNGYIAAFDLNSINGNPQTDVMEIISDEYSPVSIDESYVYRASRLWGGIYDWSEYGTDGWAAGAKRCLAPNAAGTSWVGENTIIFGGSTVTTAVLQYEDGGSVYRLMVNSDGALFRDVDAGGFALEYTATNVSSIKSIRRLNGELFAYGFGGYAHSTDDGDTWTEHTVGASQPNRAVCGMGYDSGDAMVRCIIHNESSNLRQVYETATPATDSSWTQIYSSSGSFTTSIMSADVAPDCSQFAGRISATEVLYSTDGASFVTETETDADYQAYTTAHLDIMNGQVVVWGGRFVFYSADADTPTKVEITELDPASQNAFIPISEELTCVRYDGRTSGMDMFGVTNLGRLFKTLDATYAPVDLIAKDLGSTLRYWQVDQSVWPHRHYWLSHIALQTSQINFVTGFEFDTPSIIMDVLVSEGEPNNMEMLLAPISPYQSAKQLLAIGTIIRDGGNTIIYGGLGNYHDELYNITWKDGVYAAYDPTGDEGGEEGLYVSQDGLHWVVVPDLENVLLTSVSEA